MGLRDLISKTGLVEFEEEHESAQLDRESPVRTMRQTTAQSTVMDERTARSLTERILSADTAYTRFVKQLTALETLIPEPKQRVQIVLATGQALGLTVQQVESAIDGHLKQLVEEERIFTQATETDAKASLEAERKELARLQGELQALMDQTEKLKADILNKQGRISTQEQRIEKVKRDFTAVANALGQQLRSAKEQLQGMQSAAPGC